MRVFILLALAFSTFSCTRIGEMKSSAGEPSPAAIGLSDVNVKKITAPTKTPKKSDTDKVTDFNFYTIAGFSDRKNDDDVYQPPFTKAILSNLYHDAPTKIDEKVSVIPLKGEVAPFELKIVESTRIEQDCDGSIVWETVFEPITNKIITAMKPMNFDSNPRDVTLLEAVVIYPAVAKPVLLPKKQITSAMLPKAIKPDMLSAAIDTDDDGKPDLILTDDKSFKKVAGKWQLIKEFLNEGC